MEEKKGLSEDQNHMRIALEVAREGLKLGEVPVGCIFLHKPSKTILARSHNTTNISKCCTKHCEINCISKIEDDWTQGKLQFCNEKTISDLFKNTKLYVTCEPCIMCAYALSLCCIGEVVYGCKNPHFGGNGTILSIHQTNSLHLYPSKGGVLEKESIAVLQEFYEIPNMRVPEPFRKSKPIRKHEIK